MDELSRLKHKLRSWESKFAAKHGRAPTKADVAKVAEVAAAYQKYTALKKAQAQSHPKSPFKSPLKATPKSAQKAEAAFLAQSTKSSSKLRSPGTPTTSRTTTNLKATPKNSLSNNNNKTITSTPNAKDSPALFFAHLNAASSASDNENENDDESTKPTPRRLFAFGEHLNKANQPLDLDDKSLAASTGFIDDGDPNDERVTTVTALKKLIAPSRNSKAASSFSAAANAARFATSNSTLNDSASVSWIPVSKKVTVDSIDTTKVKEAEIAVEAYLSKNSIFETEKDSIPLKKSATIGSKKHSVISTDLSDSTSIPQPGPIIKPSGSQSSTYFATNKIDDIVAPGSFALRSAKTSTSSTTFLLNRSSSFMLQSAPSTNIDASFAFSISTNESVEAASAPQQSFNSGWANNHDESETESVIAARKQSKKKRTKKVAAGMKETKAMKLAEREMIAERKAATKTLHGDDIMIEKPVRAVKRKATGEAAEAGTKRKKRDDESSDEENEDLAEKKPRKAPAAERPTRRAAISSRKVIEDTDTGEDSDDDKFVYDGDSDFDRRGGDDDEEDNDQVEDHSPDIEVPSSPSTKLSKPAVTKRSTSTKTKPRKSTETTEKGWGKAEDKSVRDRSGEIGSSNFRTLNLQKSKFGRSGRGGGGRFGGGRGGRGRSFGGSSGGGGGSRVSYKSGGGGYGGYSENPYTSKEAEEVMQDLYDETERKRLLDLPEIEFIFNAESEGLCRVSQSFFDGVQEEGDNFFVDLHAALKTLTGLETFRPGQENTIRRILQGESTILVLPTGGGKSLCYQLPAFILRRLHAKKSHQTCVTLVISPMVSLMQDQMRCLPPKLKGVSMSSGTQSITEYKKTMDLLTSDQADILYVTPEKLQTEGFQKLIQTRRISVVRLACIDEVHCLTEWSHNFRTSYLSLNSVFEEVVGVKCVLGLTATATVQARKSVVKMLGLDDTAIVAESRMRDNLKLSVSKVSGVDNRDMILENMLKTDLFSSMSSIIIYTMFQSQADNIAKYLRTRNFSAESYHAGKPPMERAILQEKFMQNRLQIMVATVAFGLGINKQDVRAVIHYNIPKSLENYSQEIGRAGRDGDKSYCHVFLCPEDYVRHRSFAYSEGVDEASVWRFILRVFGNAVAQGKGKGKGRKKQDGVSVGKVQDRLTMLIPVEATERELDMKESVLATLLTYMEGFEGRPIKVFPAIFCEYIVHFNKKSAFDMAETNPIVAAILKNTEKTKGKMTVDALKICEDADVSFSVLAQTLAELKRKKEIHYEGTTRAFHIELTNLEASERDATYLERMRTLLTTKMRDLETSRVAKLDMLYETLLNASVDSVEDVLWTANDGDEMLDCDLEVKEEAIERMETLKKAVENYFETENGTLASASNMQEEEGVEAKCLLGVKSGFRDPTLATRSDKCKKILRIDLNDFIVQNAAVITSGRAIARIFHGISSPKFPAYEWFKNKSWNSYSHFNFGELVKIASKTLMEYRMRTGNAAGEELGNEDMDW